MRYFLRNTYGVWVEIDRIRYEHVLRTEIANPAQPPFDYPLAVAAVECRGE